VNVQRLRPYQDEGADFIFEHDRSLILAPVGSGKTALTLVAMKAYIDEHIVRRFIVLAPKRVAQHVWKPERDKWTPDLWLEVAVGTPEERRIAFESEAPVVVTNFDNIQTLPDLVSFDGMVIDELTRFKRPGNPRSKKKTEQIKGKRFEAFWRAAAHINIRIGLTGSFTSNGLEDVFGQCRMIDPAILGVSKTVFLQQYFVLMNRDFGQWEPKVGSLQKVMAHIKPSTFVLEPGDYTDKLPSLHTVELRCDMPNRLPYEQMKKKFRADFPDSASVAANSGVVTGKLQQMAGGWLYDTKRAPDPERPGKWIVTQKPYWFSEHKFELLDDLLSENQHDNTLVWYWFKESLAELKRRYPKAQTLDDKNAVERWNHGEIELLLAHPQSAGHGINLQYGGCKMAFLELPWSLELYEQAIGRLHRSGQRKDVWCYVLLTDKTIDEQMWASLHDKRAVSDIAVEALR